ncbi:hypothetical protein [Nostoc sp.]
MSKYYSNLYPDLHLIHDQNCHSFADLVSFSGGTFFNSDIWADKFPL